jgi:hypothetical protein
MISKILFVIALFTLSASLTVAQETKQTTPPPVSDQEKQKQEQDMVEKLNTLELKSLEDARRFYKPVAAVSDPDAIKKYDDATKAFNEYLITGYEHRKRVFEWQLLSSRIIFLVVNLLVLVGVYFSWVQFTANQRRYLKTKTKQTPSNSMERISTEEAEEVQEITQIEASLQGIKVSSPVLGVVILVISFLFFYLYLRYVYPIHNVL